MDTDNPWKVVKVPMIRGVLAKMEPELLYECGNEDAARALMYETIRDDMDHRRGIFYTYEVCMWGEP